MRAMVSFRCGSQPAFDPGALRLGLLVVGRAAADLQVVVLDVLEAFVGHSAAEHDRAQERQDVLRLGGSAEADEQDRVDRRHRRLRSWT
jgi:hypothetical protein